MTKERLIPRLNEILLDSTGFNMINNMDDLREFLFRLIILFPSIDFKSNIRSGGFLFYVCDRNGDEFKYNVVDLLNLKENDSFRNMVNHELFISEINEYRSASTAAQMFGGVSLMNKDGRMVMLEKEGLDHEPELFIDAYDTASEIISTGKMLLGDGFRFGN